jgi:CelD/BcsL family acetyltransferase involved in cellulose biosynthesis
MSVSSLCAEETSAATADASCADCTHKDPVIAQPASGPLLYTVYGPDATPDGFTALASEWNQVLQRSRFNSIFLTHEWQTTWWRYQGEGDLWIVALRRPDNGELVGIVPLYCVKNQDGPFAGQLKLNLVGCIEVSDYLDAIVARGWEEAVYQTLLAWLQSPTAPAWDVLDLCNLPEASVTYQVVPALYRQAGLRVDVTQDDTAPQFSLPLHYEEYLEQQVDKKQRHEIRRKQRRAERETAVGFYFVGKEHCLEAELDDFIALQRASRPDKSEFMTPEMHRFFTAAARTMADAGYLRLCFLTLNGEKAAALLAFQYDRRFWLYNSGYDPDAHAHLSPGWVILAYTIQYAIAAGCRVFDFMQGDEEYKYRFGGEDYQVMRVLVYRD